MIKNKKLLEILTLVGRVNSGRWETVREIVKCIQENPSIEFVKKEWADKFKRENPQYYPLDLSKISTWSTHDNSTCIDIEFSNKDGKLYCKARIYNGSLLDGYRTELKFTVEFFMPNSFLKTISQRIMWSLDSFAEDAYEQHLEAKRKMWVNNFKSEVLSDGKDK